MYDSWKQFKQHIKWESRFLVSGFDLIKDAEWDTLLNMGVCSNISQEQSFYRARVHPKAGMSPFDKQELGAPPKDKATPGRANPEGIPYLYLCEDPATTLYETRASYLDEVSIGTFRSKGSKSLRVVDFSVPPSLYDIYTNSASSMREVVRSKILHTAINLDLSKPIRRYDSSFEYIPTQFICEYIRCVVGLDGIRYYSALRPGAVNVVLFYPDQMECVDAKVVRVIENKIKSEKLNK